MRLIDADALRADAITRSGGTEFAFDNCYPFWQFSQAIAQAPTIEAAPVVHGRWEKFTHSAFLGYKDGGPIWADRAVYRCDHCHFGTIAKHNYCPRCGAIMDGDSKAPTTPTTNYRVCKHCKTAVIGMEEYAECPECGHPFEEVAHA